MINECYHCRCAGSWNGWNGSGAGISILALTYTRIRIPQHPTGALWMLWIMRTLTSTQSGTPLLPAGAVLPVWLTLTSARIRIPLLPAGAVPVTLTFAQIRIPLPPTGALVACNAAHLALCHGVPTWTSTGWPYLQNTTN
jgi:hypothetical protein